LRRLLGQAGAGEAFSIPLDPVEFAESVLGWRPLPYQARLLRDPSKRIVVRMCRQSGKTTTIAVRAIWHAATHPRALTLIVSPSMRQSMIMMDRVWGLLMGLREEARRRLVSKIQRTVVWFRNGSQIVALPCSVHLLRGYTAHQILCDEASFFRDDETVFYSVFYPMLATTDGTLIASSTPWGRSTVFYSMNSDPCFSKHVVTWREVVESGLVSGVFIEEMRRVMPPERFRREFEAEFAEDADSYFGQDLIAGCVDAELEYYGLEDQPQGEFYVGVDLGKKVDYSAVAVVERGPHDTLRLRHMHMFPLETPYAAVIGYVKAICSRYRHVVGVLCDRTGVGEYVVEDMARSGIPRVEGITLTQQRKMEVLGALKQRMHLRALTIPYDPELIAEINCERFEADKIGLIRFSHPEAGHDDRLWALALAAYAAKPAPAAPLARGHSIVATYPRAAEPIERPRPCPAYWAECAAAVTLESTSASKTRRRPGSPLRCSPPPPPQARGA
jgi:phage FluMu gp28-like protein